jgi:hypothetical protein
VSKTDTAVLCEIGPEPAPGRLARTSLAIFNKDLPGPLFVATLQEACAVARTRRWTLVPIPDPDEDYRPESARNLSDEAWATIQTLMFG